MSIIYKELLQVYKTPNNLGKMKKNVNRYLIGEIQMATKHMKKSSTSLTVKAHKIIFGYHHH